MPSSEFEDGLPSLRGGETFWYADNRCPDCDEWLVTNGTWEWCPDCEHHRRVEVDHEF